MDGRASLQTEISLNKELVSCTLTFGFHFDTLMLLTGLLVKSPCVENEPFYDF